MPLSPVRIVAALALVIASCLAGAVTAVAAPTPAAAMADEPTVVDLTVGNLSAGGETSCEVRPDATAWCWGDNRYGQLGIATNQDRSLPVQVLGGAVWQSIDTGGSITCGVQLDSSLWCWGANHRGQLGIGTNAASWHPVRVGVGTWQRVSTGWTNACGVATDGSLWCWGSNHFGQLSQGDTTDRPSPTQVGTSRRWVDVSVGGQHACGRVDDGRLLCWGRNDFGQLGVGDTLTRKNSRDVAVQASWKSVSAGWRSTCAVDSLDRAWCWGDNSSGQLGVTGTGATAPTHVAGSTWQSVTVGDTFTCGLDPAGATFCWGSNRYGQLGDGQAILDTRIRRIASPATWTQIDAGWYHVCGRANDGTRQCWGNNEQAQLALGGGDRTDRSTPAGAIAAAPSFALGKQGRKFSVSTFNILGSQHTEPGGGVPYWAPGRLRSEWAADVIAGTGSSIVAIQESQRDQVVTLQKILGQHYDFWPGTSLSARHGWQTVMWDRRVWTREKTQSLELPVLGTTRPHPVILLSHRKTGRKVWVLNVHNSSKQTKERIRERNKAMKKINRVVRNKERTGAEMLLVGDFNDRKRAFCSVVGNTDLESAFGGSVTTTKKKNKKIKKVCRPPRNMGIDWIFNSPGLKNRTATRTRTAAITSVADHPVVTAALTIRR